MFAGLAVWRVAVAMAPAWAASAEPPPLQAYGSLPSLNYVEISPDGARLALLTTRDERSELQVRSVSDLKLVARADAGKVKVRGLQWAGDHHLLIATSSTDFIMGLSGWAREYTMLADYDLAHHQLRSVMEPRNRALNTIAAPPMIRTLQGKPVAFLQGISFPDRQGVRTLYRADLDDRRFNEMLVGDDNTSGWIVDDQGQPLARSEYDQRTGRLSIQLMVAGRWTERLTETALIEHSSLLGLGRDDRSVLVSDPHADPAQVHELASDGASSDPLPAGMDGIVFDPARKTLIGGRRTGELRTEYTFLSKADQQAWSAVAKAFKDEEVQLTSWSDDRKRLVVCVAGAAHGYAYYLVDLSAGRADWLGDVYQGVGPDKVAPVTLIHYAASDGLDIPAYLTLPKGRDPHGLPLVVLPHGGPAARDEPGFDWWSQALASRGYAVLQPEFRGSSGLGDARLRAGFGEWGRRMQADLSDGVRALAKQGVADAKRVCIVGGSYGGYAALAGVTLDLGVYRCAVSLAGPSDLRSLLAYERSVHNGAQNVTLRYWDRFMGVSSPGDPKLDTLSPARLADRVNVPVLLIHGRDDTVVPFDQSTAMQRAMKRAGKPVELVALKGEDHWLSRSETRLQMLHATVAFLEANNPAYPVKGAGS